jgi:apoptosis-inducing factor 3
VVPKLPGVDLKNIFVLRTHNDQEGIKAKAAQAKKVVIVGGGFIGSETASALKGKYKDDQEVHLLYVQDVLLTNQIGKEVGRGVENEHKTNGVVLHPNSRVSEFRGKDGAVSSVVLSDGRELEADLVILGVGVLPATKFLEGSGIQLDKVGAVVVDPFLQTTAKDVYAAGDIASFPYWVNGRQTRIEHYNVAMDQGSHAAFNMLGKMVPFGNIPFFWTRHYNKSI